MLSSVGVAGDIIDKILDCGFDITALWLMTLEKANAEEFLEVYKGVVQEYPMLVNELSSGPCIAMEIRAKDAAKTFREYAGPADPVIFANINANIKLELIVVKCYWRILGTAKLRMNIEHA